MSSVRIEEDSSVEYAIVDRGAVISKGARIGGSRDQDKLTVIARDVVIGPGAVVEPGEIVTEDRL